MTLGGKVTLSAGALVAIVAAGFLLRECGFHAGRQYERQVVEDRTSDVQVAHTDSAARADTMAWHRTRDSLARAGQMAALSAAAAQHRADSLEQLAHAAGDLVPKAVVDAALAAKNEELAAKDVVIAQDSVGIRARDGRIARLLGTVASYRDTIVPDLARERDRWRSQARGRCGAEVTPGYALLSRGADVVVGYGCRIPLPWPF